MELRWYVEKWTDYSHNDGRSSKIHAEEPVLQYRMVSSSGAVTEWKEVPTVIEHTA